jgi:hypothetical protein
MVGVAHTGMPQHVLKRKKNGSGYSPKVMSPLVAGIYAAGIGKRRVQVEETDEDFPTDGDDAGPGYGAPALVQPSRLVAAPTNLPTMRR